MFLLNLLAKPVYAQCPVCVVTVGGGLFLAKQLGIDDMIVSIWLSALNTAIAFWIATKFKRKWLDNAYLWTAAFFLFTLAYVVFSKQVGVYKNTFLGIDKIVFGLVLGLAVSVKAILLDKFLRGRNKGKVFFPYQKVVIPFVILIIITIVGWLLIRK